MKSQGRDSQSAGMAQTVESSDPSDFLRPGPIQSEHERGTSVSILILMHLWPIFGVVTGLFLPFMFTIPIIWACLKDRSSLLDDQGREIINTMLTLLVLLVVPIIGWLALLVWVPVWFISAIRGAIAVGNREYFRYPMTIRFIS